MDHSIPNKFYPFIVLAPTTSNLYFAGSWISSCYCANFSTVDNRNESNCCYFVALFAVLVHVYAAFERNDSSNNVIELAVSVIKSIELTKACCSPICFACVLICGFTTLDLFIGVVATVASIKSSVWWRFRPSIVKSNRYRRKQINVTYFENRLANNLVAKMT